MGVPGGAEGARPAARKRNGPRPPGGRHHESEGRPSPGRQDCTQAPRPEGDSARGAEGGERRGGAGVGGGRCGGRPSARTNPGGSPQGQGEKREEEEGASGQGGEAGHVAQGG
uniref:Uncharacterized protein n=1 Tax=Pristionchus pacificus TaxID=54126 RepID=A0A2A6BG82_PRIPA|eukprot:PDM64892.1 hypothetical protein PRIPAC_53148 [Pristionchus pacificus]